jgi:hypothetical protein
MRRKEIYKKILERILTMVYVVENSQNVSGAVIEISSSRGPTE